MMRNSLNIKKKRIKEKSDSWKRLADRRTDKVIENLISLRKLADIRNYHFQKEQIVALKKILRKQVDITIETFEIELQQLERKEERIFTNLPTMTLKGSVPDKLKKGENFK